MSEDEPYRVEDLLGEFGARWGIRFSVPYEDGPKIDATPRGTDDPDIRIVRATVEEMRDELRETERRQAAQP